MSSLRKLFAVGSMVALFAALVPMSAVAAPHGPGSVVKSSDGTVWFITSDNQRRAFTSAGAFLSYGFLSFAQVVDANAEDLALPTGSFIPPQDGKIICSDRGADRGTCYLITGGKKAGFTSAAVFTGLGHSFSRVTHGDVSWMESTSLISNTGDAHRPGVLVNNNGTVQLVVNGGLYGIPSLAVFNSWGYSFADVVPANGADKQLTQIGVMTARQPGQLSPSATSVVNPPQGSNMTVTLGPNNPAASTLIAGQGTARLGEFTLGGNGTIQSVTLQRIGVSSDATLQNVYLYDGNTRLTEAASVSSGSITFSGLNLNVSGSRNLSVRADISSSATAGQTVGVSLQNVTLASGTVSGTPVSSNIHTIAVADLATVAISSVTPSGTPTVNAANDMVVFQATMNVGTRPVNFTRLSLREIGSINFSDIRNFRLMIDGQQVATASGLDAMGYVTFTSSGRNLNTGSHTIQVLADVVGGSGRTMSFSLRNTADLGVSDSQYGVELRATGIPATTGTTTIAAGTVTAERATNSPAGDVTLDASDVALARFSLTAFGEPVRVESLTIALASSDTTIGSLRNGRIMVNGTQMGSTASLSRTGNTTFNTNFTIQPGSPVIVEVRADMFDNDGTNNVTAGDTFTVTLVQGSNNAQGQQSFTLLNVPSANVPASTVTVAAGTISVAAASTYPSQTVVAPASNFKLAHFNLTGNSTEAVNIHTITLNFTGADAGDGGTTVDFDATDLTNVYVKIGNVTSSVKPTVTATGNTFSVNVTLPQSGSLPVEVYGNVGSSISTDTMTVSIVAQGTAATSGQSVQTNGGTPVNGQTIAGGTGALTAVLDGTSLSAGLVDDQSTQEVAAFRFSAANDTFTVTRMNVDLAGASTVSEVRLKVGGNVVATMPGATDVSFTGLNINVPANGTTVVSVEVVTNTVGTGAGATGENIQVTLDTYRERNSQGVETDRDVNVVANVVYVFKAYPTLSSVCGSGSGFDTQLVAGTRTLMRYTVASTGGTISWKETTFNVSKSGAAGGIAITNARLYDASTGAEIAGTATLTTLTDTSTAGTIEFEATTEQQVSASRTYELRADIGGTIAAGNFVTTSIQRGSGLTAQTSAAFATVDATAATFIWSDIAIAGHDTSTADWHNDYLVRSLPISCTMSRS
jgi:hypothetical protein